MQRWLVFALWSLVLVAFVVSQLESEVYEVYNYRQDPRQEVMERYGRAQRLHALNRLLKKPVFTFSHFFKKEM